MSDRHPAAILAIMMFSAAAAACGSSSVPASREAAPAMSTAPPSGPTDIAPADPAIRYFHEQLVINGEEVQSDFGGYLLALEMNPRDLQQDTPEHAYQLVLQKVRDVRDAGLRREMMRTFFGTDSSR